MQADLFADANSIVVHQTKEWREMIGIRRPNRFSIDFGDQPGMLLAEEHFEGWTRFFLGSLRTYRLVIQQRTGKPVLRLSSAFRLFQREMIVASGDGQTLGTVRRRFSLLRARYDVFDAHGAHLFDIARGLLERLAFTVRRGDNEVGSITKRWHMFNPRPLEQAERYEMDFASVHSPMERALLLGALFLIDFQHFETSGDE